MEKTGYNGWTNYETWNVKLWIDNDEGSYNFWQQETSDAWFNASEGDAWHGCTRLESATAELSNRLESAHTENTPTVTGCYADLLNAALSKVNWHEIAASMLEDADFKEETEESEADNG